MQSKIVIDFTNLDHQLPNGDILLFACKHPIFVNGKATTQTIISSRICTASGSTFLFLPPGDYWAYAIGVDEDISDEGIHQSYTQVYKFPENVFEIGSYKTDD